MLVSQLCPLDDHDGRLEYKYSMIKLLTSHASHTSPMSEQLSVYTVCQHQHASPGPSVTAPQSHRLSPLHCLTSPRPLCPSTIPSHPSLVRAGRSQPTSPPSLLPSDPPLVHAGRLCPVLSAVLAASCLTVASRRQ